MSRLVVLLLILTPWVMHSMEPEEVTKELELGTLYLEGKEEELPVLPALPNQIIAQELLSNGPIKRFILSQVSLPFKTCVGHINRITSVEFNSTGDKMVTGSQDGTAKIWDVETGACLRTLPDDIGWYTQPDHIGWVVSAEFNLNGDRILTLASEDAPKIWDSVTGELLHTLGGHTDTVMSAAFTPAGDTVITDSDDGTAKIWNVETGELLNTLEGHTVNGMLIALNPGSDKEVTRSFDDTARIWDIAVCKLLSGHMGLRSFAKAVGDKVVIAGTRDITGNTARMWDLKPQLSAHEFLAKNSVLTKAVIMNAIYETMKVRGIVKALKGRAFVSGARILSPEQITFDFNTYPKLWDAYRELPEAIRKVFDPYVTKPSNL